MNIIEAKYLTKVYKSGDYGLRNCSLSVRQGEFLVVVGASGEGKSTLLKVLAGTEKLSSGELYIDGILAESLPSAKRDVSMVFQEYLLYPHMTVFDNLATPLKLKGEDEKSIYDRVMEALCLFGLERLADVKPKNLSGGEQQRCALAKALLRRSRLILLDEPM
ncbi:MAG: ABC transporter ATP-binding protein, partial [Clostridia bacterium]|nr:ABC transporter ATP-binding protein [Clostridia bacterium]